MFIVTINADECSGCGECIATCPGQIITLVDAKAVVTGDMAECLGCQSCVVVCEGGAVTVEEF